MKKLLFIAFCLSAIGCQSYEHVVYDVQVHNNTTGPVTVWLTKDGPPFEPGWLAPEDIAIESPKQPVHVISGLVIPTGKTGFTGPRTGQFQPGTNAVLRVYAGQLTFDQLLSFDQGDKHRVDQRLHPGMNDLVISGGPGPGGIDVKEAQAAP